MSDECSVMEIKRRNWSSDPDDAESSNENEYESEKQQSRKRRIIGANVINKYRKKAAKASNDMKSSNVCDYANESNPFDDTNISEKFVWRNKIEGDVVKEGFCCTRPTNTDNSHLPDKIMCSWKEEKRKERERMEEEEKVKRREERMGYWTRGAEFKEYAKKTDELFLKQMKAGAKDRLCEGRGMPIDVLSMHLVEPYSVFESLAVKDLEYLRRDIKVYLDLDRETPPRICYWEALLVVCDWKLGEARKKEALIRAMLHGEQPSAELLGEERGLQADVENLLRGKTHGELELIQSKIELQIRSGPANVVEYWEPILKCIHVCKAKAFLEEFHAMILRKCLEMYRGSFSHQEAAAGFDKKSDQAENEEVEGTGSSCSPGLLHGEEIGDNFEMKTMGVMEECDALSSNNEEVILQSQVYRCHNKCRLRRPKYCNSVNTDSEWNHYNKTHYDIIMAHYGYD